MPTICGRRPRSNTSSRHCRPADRAWGGYCWYATIDERDHVRTFGPQPLDEGWVLQRLCADNMIGNGSTLLVRRSAFEPAGGYDTSLRARGAEGAEDFLICLRIAEHAEFRVVPRYLVGYRQVPGSMSTNSMTMFRSTEIALGEYRRRFPDYADEHRCPSAGLPHLVRLGRVARRAMGRCRRVDRSMPATRPLVAPPALRWHGARGPEGPAVPPPAPDTAADATLHRHDLVTLCVVIPAYNAAETLAEALDSLLAQTRGDWTAIVVDDGSTDGTRQLAETYVARDKRFRLLSDGRPRQGASAARNRGIAAADGRWLAFLDADDWLEPPFVEKMVGELEAAADAKVAYCGSRRVAPDGRQGPLWMSSDVARMPFEVFARRCPVPIHGFVLDRELVVELGGFDERLRTCEDWDFWQRVARTGVAFLPVPDAARPLPLQP